jgi:cytochrome c-type biogenesis protein
MADVTLIVAFVAGIVSFLSPCVLPIVPGFLAYLAGASLDGAGKSGRSAIFLHSFIFVLGFSSVFAILGVLLNTLLSSVAYDAQTWLARIGGAIVIFFGLYLVGLIKIPFLEQEHKFRVTKKFSSRHLTSFVFGAFCLFARTRRAVPFGWALCFSCIRTYQSLRVHSSLREHLIWDSAHCTWYSCLHAKP